MNVAEKADLQDSLADACSAIGTMYNTMVGLYHRELCMSKLSVPLCLRVTMTKQWSTLVVVMRYVPS